MSILDTSEVAAYNELYDSELYVRCQGCNRQVSTGTPRPTVRQLLIAAHHDCPADRPIENRPKETL